MLNPIKLFAAKETQFDSVIGPNVTIAGDITFTGELRIDGTVQGEINVYRSTQGTLMIGRTGRVEGKVNVTNAVVSGRLDGSLHATEVVGVSSAGQVAGDIEYGRLVVRGQGRISGRMKPLDTEGREFARAFGPDAFQGESSFDAPRARATGT